MQLAPVAHKLGQISLTTTTLFWGAGGNLKYIVLAWASLALGCTAQASSLTGVVAIGTAVGAIVASMKMRLDSHARDPDGHRHGPAGRRQDSSAASGSPCLLILLGGLGGFLVVPMTRCCNTRPQPDGGSRSIAVQNFNEQSCILVLGAFYSLHRHRPVGYSAPSPFGVVVAGFMWLIKRWHMSNLRKYPEEVEHLLAIARSDKHH
jgi:hypothetical protein